MIMIFASRYGYFMNCHHPDYHIVVRNPIRCYIISYFNTDSKEDLSCMDLSIKEKEMCRIVNICFSIDGSVPS